MNKLFGRAIAMGTACILGFGAMAVQVPASEALEAESMTLEAEDIAAESTEAEDPEAASYVRGSSYDPVSYDGGDDEIVIVLDPGHDNKHTGSEAVFDGVEVHEEELVVLIAKYMKRKLLTYDNVRVYLTHDGTSEQCPFDAKDDKECLKARVAFAESLGADYFISLHLNKSPNASVEGIEMLYPNSNYNEEVSEDGKALSEAINGKLQELGLETNCVHSRDSDDEHYPDGSVADYYSVIRNSKLAGITGIIVEHCHMDIRDEYEAYLSDNAKLKELAIKDAEAVAEYLNLEK